MAVATFNEKKPLQIGTLPPSAPFLRGQFPACLAHKAAPLARPLFASSPPDEDEFDAYWDKVRRGAVCGPEAAAAPCYVIVL